jgi:hypothetical protein
MKSLNKLIKEELQNILNEYSDEEYVERDKISLQREYDDLNQLLWDGKLPKVPLEWNALKRAYGRVRGMYNRYTKEVFVKNLEMSSLYKLTYRQFKNIMAHEQIHVWQMGIMKEKGGHGWDFMGQARRINSMGLGFKITEKNGEDIAVADDAIANAKKRTLIGIILNIDGEYGLTVTTPSVYNTEFDLIQGLFERLVNRGQYRNVEITVVETTSPQIMNLPVSRTFRKAIRHMKLNDRLLEELLNDNIIKNVKIKKGAPAEITEDAMPGDSKEWEEISIT